MQKWALSTQLEIVCNIHKVQQASCCFGWLAQAKQSKAKAKAKQCEMQCRLRSWMYRAHHIRTQNNWSSKQQFVSLRAVSQLSDTVSKRRSCVFANFEFFPPLDISFAVQPTIKLSISNVCFFLLLFSMWTHSVGTRIILYIGEMCTSRRKPQENLWKFNRRLKMA